LIRQAVKQEDDPEFEKQKRHHAYCRFRVRHDIERRGNGERGG
jgi:hypothetical protein